MSSTKNILQLIQAKCPDFGALHGTSFLFVDSLLQKHQIQNGGNFDNYFYILVRSQSPGLDVEESAGFYAEMNAIKDLLFSSHPQFIRLMKDKNIDPYLFTIGLGKLNSPFAQDEIPPGFENFTPAQIKIIRQVIVQAQDEDRRGVIIYFSPKLLQDFEVEDLSIFGQKRIKLSKPITADYICAITMQGKYEQNRAQQLLESTK